MPTASSSSPTPDHAVFDRNMRVLRERNPWAANAISAAAPRDDLEWTLADDGRWTASVDGRALSSRRRAWAEAERFAEGLDPIRAGAALVTGFGVGHHVEAVCGVMGRGGMVVCFEPDASLLRTVLERIDCSAWLRDSNLALMTDETDTGSIAEALRGVEGVVSLGIKVMHHQPSQPRLGQRAATFCAAFTSVIEAMRTTVVTTLMQTETTLRNLLANADWYAGAAGAGELEGCARGRPAVVVSAGPSLCRNLHLLGRPGVRDRVVIIAVQTVLKPMLEAGIRPHFVVAVDYHEISKRFYEGLTARDVEGVTLLCDPKANPVICETFPGAVRTLHDGVLQGVLAAVCHHDRVSVPASATVAHLAYSAARLMGCDPVVLIGQDLGFTDNVYYGPGAAIHEVWAGELNTLRTLETLEWERIARGRRQSRRLEDIHGRPIYTDEQMHTYLLQFERMFAEDVARGLSVIDATEGGVAKRHAQVMTLADALAAHVDSQSSPIVLPTAHRDEAARRAAGQRVADHLQTIADQVREIAELSRQTAGLLDEMIAAKGDQRKIAPLVDRAHKNGARANALQPGFDLAQYLNQTGTLKRFRADRELHYQSDLNEIERQSRQIERDKMNVTWLADACDVLEDLLERSCEALRTGEKPTTDPRDHAIKVESREPVRMAAIIAVDPERDALGVPRALGRGFAGGSNPLRRTLQGLAKSVAVERAVLLAEDVERVRTIVGGPIEGLEVSIDHVGAHPLGAKRAMVASSRRVAPACWRGGPGGSTVFDEAFSAPAVLAAMDRHSLDAAVIVGCDWAAIDPGLTDQCCARHSEHPSRNRMVFTQAAPGLGPIVLGRSLIEELAPHEGAQRLWTSLAGLFGYTPVAPIADPIAKSLCVRVDPALRDLPIRCIADGTWHGRMLSRAVRAGACDAQGLARYFASPVWHRHTSPMEVVLELCTGRLVGGHAAITRLGRHDPPERAPIDPGFAHRLIDQLAEASPGAMLTLAGAGDPMLHPHWERIVAAATSAGLGVHVRTDLVADRPLEGLVDLSPDVVSVDHYADDPVAYTLVAGTDHYERVRRATESLVEQRDARAQAMWVVPRIARCDEVLDQIEGFYDRWLLTAGACVIDRPWRGAEHESAARVRTLPLPRLAQLRRRAWLLRVRCDGVASRPGNSATVDLSQHDLMEAWARLRRAKKLLRAAA